MPTDENTSMSCVVANSVPSALGTSIVMFSSFVMAMSNVMQLSAVGCTTLRGTRSSLIVDATLIASPTFVAKVFSSSTCTGFFAVAVALAAAPGVDGKPVDKGGDALDISKSWLVRLKIKDLSGPRLHRRGLFPRPLLYSTTVEL